MWFTPDWGKEEKQISFDSFHADHGTTPSIPFDNAIHIGNGVSKWRSCYLHLDGVDHNFDFHNLLDTQDRQIIL